MTCNKDITAVFVRITYPLAIGVSPDDSGKVVMEPPQPAEGYIPGTEITVKAIASEGYRFSNWGGAVSGSENPTTIIMDSEKQISANFIEVPWLQSSWWWIAIGVILTGFLVYFLKIRRPGSHGN